VPTLEAVLVAWLLCRSVRRDDRALRPDDLRPLVEYVLQAHPGLDFLSDADNAFGVHYVDTVIARLYFEAGKSGVALLSPADLVRVGFVATLWQLESCDDVNDVRRIWSYEHFYVLYTTFWKMDHRHVLAIERDALAEYVAPCSSLTPHFFVHG
jgi:serine/threonine-protein phosphatase 2A regulatory subunit B''